MNSVESMLAAAMGSMPMSGLMIWGVSLSAFLMALSGVVYLLCGLLLWKTVRQEKNELVNALFAFLMYQAVNMFFMGLQMHTMNMLYSNIAALAVFIGSAYMLKFPLSRLSATTRKVTFYLTLAFVIGLFAWFMQTMDRQMNLMNFTLWYDMVVNGLVVGGSVIWFAIKSQERTTKLKAWGGGTGVTSCCVVANGAMLTGAMLTSSVFAFLAPVLILGTLMFKRR